MQRSEIDTYWYTANSMVDMMIKYSLINRDGSYVTHIKFNGPTYANTNVNRWDPIRLELMIKL